MYNSVPGHMYAPQVPGGIQNMYACVLGGRTLLVVDINCAKDPVRCHDIWLAAALQII